MPHTIAKTASSSLRALLLIALCPSVLAFLGLMQFDKLHNDIEDQTFRLNEQVFEIESNAFKIAASGLELAQTNSELVQRSISSEQAKYASRLAAGIEKLSAESVEKISTQDIELGAAALVANTAELIPLLQGEATRQTRIEEVIAFLNENFPEPHLNNSTTSEVLLKQSLVNRQIQLLLATPFQTDHDTILKASKSFSALDKQYEALNDHPHSLLDDLHSYVSIIANRTENIFIDQSTLLTLKEDIRNNYLQSLILTEQLVSSLKELTTVHATVMDTERKSLRKYQNTVLSVIALSAIIACFLFLKLKRLIQNTIISRIVRLAEFTNASAARENATLPTSTIEDEITSTERSVQNFIVQRDVLEGKITDRLKARTEQLSLESKIVDAYFFGSSDGLVIVNDNGLILRSNQVFNEIFPDFYADSTKGRFIGTVFDKYLSAIPLTTTFTSKDGREFRIRSIPIKTAPETALSLYLFENVTELKDAEKEVNKLTKLRLLGELSGGIAHDFNNTLSAFQGVVYLIADDSFTLEAKPDVVRLLQAGIDQGSAITSQLLDFTRIESKNKGAKPANQILRECAALAEKMSMGKVFITLDARSETAINIDHELLINALLNLFTNAKDASDQFSEIILRCYDTTLEGEDCIVFEVQDFGRGIKPEHLSRVTEPLFTTKPFGKGTGIGLSSVLRLTKRAGGSLDIQSSVDVGTTVSLTLPAGTEKVQIPQNNHTETLQGDAHQSILVVDDNIIFGELISKHLIKLGYKVEFAATLNKVKDSITQAPDWNIIICDVHLISAHGSDVFELCLQHGVGQKFIFMSGNLSTDDISKLNSLGDCHILDKPFRFEEIENIIKAEDYIAEAKVDQTEQA